jgi:hypothetical protein
MRGVSHPDRMRALLAREHVGSSPLSTLNANVRGDARSAPRLSIPSLFCSGPSYRVCSPVSAQQ